VARVKGQIDLTRYVSNLDRNVYTIYNLPEEVIAVIFAYVSRSPLSFRDNLKKLLEDDELAVSDAAGGITSFYSEKAARFHEKWVVGYGHSSVAEHAVAHIGIERISRLASAELELANSFNSFTEYSQRYQRPRRGDWYLPPELQDHPEAQSLYADLQEKAYDTYERLLSGLIGHLADRLPRHDGESEKRFRIRVEKTAFEDARYVLTLATLTNLGMTGNGRALRDTLIRLLSSRYPECRQLAREMEREIGRVIPTLLKHVKPSPYIMDTRESLEKRWKETKASARAFSEPAGRPSARFLRLPDYEDALTQAAVSLLIENSTLSYEEAEEKARALSRAEKEELIDEALKRLRFFDNPLDSFQHLVYRLELKISEANWHQLLRHNRRTHFTWGLPTTELGYTIPPRIRDAGLADPFSRLVEQATETYRKIREVCPAAAPYCVTNAHHRQVTATVTLWELYHLINLRTSPEAQWDIRTAFEELLSELKRHHPVLARYARRRAEDPPAGGGA
jgi:thymidylate synthase ThyX